MLQNDVKILFTLISICKFILECFVLNTGSTPYSSINADPSSPSPAACQVTCQNNPSCSWFNWLPSGGGCWLLGPGWGGDKTGEESVEGVVTGPRFCEGELNYILSKCHYMTASGGI